MEGEEVIPKAFMVKRLHSITGFFIVLYLIEHLLVNSQAALLSNGTAFVAAVNGIQALPFLPLLEIGLLAVPIGLHAYFGIAMLSQGKWNSAKSDFTKPSLPQYGRNRAYTWQRITAWILLFTIVAHVIHMRIIEYPTAVRDGEISPANPLHYMVRVQADEGLPLIARQLGVTLYTSSDLAKSQEAWEKGQKHGDANIDSWAKNKNDWFTALEQKPLRQGEVIASSPNFGTAELLMVRETFKMPLMIALYTIFVLSACFHAFNGLWTFLITWGVTQTPKIQSLSLYFCYVLMCIVAFLGLSSIWGSYWINLNLSSLF